ncbi:regulatory protein RecX [Polycladidibacter stylochi]|uniref:regulatory protein RecX n=1 Tax=Polycladidibacter stylochi TaxID=1807766 RepID=UPI00082C2A30|nr:regulatory protein RecX [Pseudovibrio stylochi]
MNSTFANDYLIKAAYAYLGRYASSKNNLKRVLERKLKRICQKKEIDPQDYLHLVDQVAIQCEQHGLLDDLVYTQSKIRVGLARGKSQRAIKSSLLQKGVEPTILQKGFDTSQYDELKAANYYAKRRGFGNWREGGDSNKVEKQLQAMVRAGFPYKISQLILKAPKAVLEQLYHNEIDPESFIHEAGYS